MLNEWRQYREIEWGEHIVVGGDCSAGLGDYSCCQWFSKSRLDVPLVYHSPKIASEMTIAILPVLERIFDKTGIKPTIAYERNNGGVFEMERLALLNRNSKYCIYEMPKVGNIENPEPTKLGYDTNTATRPAMLTALKEAVDKQLIRIYDEPTIRELFSFIIVNTSSSQKAQAERNKHDDLIMALAISYQLHLNINIQMSAVNNAVSKKSVAIRPSQKLSFYA